MKVATKDHHPRDHISFAANHKDKKPFEDYITIVNPANASESYTSRLWPVHCVQGTPGNELLKELSLAKVDRVVEKGKDARVEMYSAFKSPLQNPALAESVSELEDLLKQAGVTHVFVTGLAGDYCVLNTAVDARKAGFVTYVVEEAVRSVDPGEGWEAAKKRFREQDIAVVKMAGKEVGKVEALKK